jgi:uncharacterized protein (TIGR04255 family)
MPNKFQNPPLVEAVCEFRFKSKSWDPTIAGILFPKIEEYFSKKESVQEGSVELFFDAKVKKEPEISHSESEFPKFSNDAGNIFTIMKKNAISIHCIKPYSNWEEFNSKIKFILDKYQESANPEKLDRVGLRYINKISLPKIDFIFSDYFKIKVTPLEDIIKVEDINAMQIGVVSKSDNSLIKTQFVWLGDKNENKEFILDIDCFTDNPGDMDDWLEKSHSKIEKIFLSSLNEKTITTFN